MTEAEWLRCDDPKTMLAALPEPCSQRKVVLYVCAGVRSLWHLLYDDCSRNGIEVLERNADGKATEEEVVVARYYAESPTFGYDFDPEFVRAHRAAGPETTSIDRLIAMGVYKEEDLVGDELVVEESVRLALVNLAHIVYHAFHAIEDGKVYWHLLEHIADQAEWPKGPLVREVFGNPFCRVAIHPDWLAWNGNTVVQLAEGIYDDRAFDRLPILGDALEEAGCDDDTLLGHLRGPGPHVRGCWALDAILGKA